MKALLTIAIILLNFSIGFTQTTPENAPTPTEKPDKSLEEELEEAANKGLESLEKLFNKKPKNSTDRPESKEKATSSEKEASERKSSVPHKNYFVGSFNATLESYTKDKMDKFSPMLVEYHFGPEDMAMKMTSDGKPTSVMIIDINEESMIMVIDMEEKQAIKTDISRMMTKDWGMETYEARKTGNSKTIDGYSCEEYEITSDDGVTTTWVTKELGLDSKKMMENLFYFSKASKQSFAESLKKIDGFPIMTTTITKNGKSKLVMKYSDIKIGTYDTAIFNTAQYDIMEMPSFKF